MVRLMLTFTPVVCVLSAIAFSECFSVCLVDLKEKTKTKSSEKDKSTNGNSTDNKGKLYDKVRIFLYLFIIK